MSTPLLLHQKQALSWMCARENKSGLPPFWEKRGELYYNTVTCFSAKEIPARVRGGILADDMGLVSEWHMRSYHWIKLSKPCILSWYIVVSLNFFCRHFKNTHFWWTNPRKTISKIIDQKHYSSVCADGSSALELNTTIIIQILTPCMTYTGKTQDLAWANYGPGAWCGLFDFLMQPSKLYPKYIINLYDPYTSAFSLWCPHSPSKQYKWR